MSKSKQNTVDPDDIIGSYGADTARWFVLSDLAARARRDLDRGRRTGRMAIRAAPVASGRRDAPSIAAKAPGGAAGAVRRARRLAIRKAAHAALAKVSDDIEKLRFNRCIAHIYEFANALSSAIGDVTSPADITPDFAWAIREAGDILVQLFAPMMPHLAEECWARPGPPVAGVDAGLAEVEAALAGGKYHHPARFRSTVRSALM